MDKIEKEELKKEIKIVKDSQQDWHNCLINYTHKTYKKTANKLISIFKSNKVVCGREKK